jgi:hypothetical protein
VNKTIWISYDLGVKGDYPGLYAWLDNAGAVECGDSLAFIKKDIPDTTSLPLYIKGELLQHVTFAKTDRVYIIWRAAMETIKGAS